MPAINSFDRKGKLGLLLIGLLFLWINTFAGATEDSLKISYVLDVHQPHTHLFKITLTVENVKTSYVDFAIPVWMPGYYRIRNFSRNIQELEAWDANSRQLRFTKLDHHTWRVFNEGESTVQLKYKVFANDLYHINIAGHIDETHAFFNGAAVFLYVVGEKNKPVKLTILKPENWKIATGLERSTRPHTFLADGYDQLIDCPTEIGDFAHFDIPVKGKPHHLVFYGLENMEAASIKRIIKRIKKDIAKIVETCCNIFGDLPYEEYTFIYHLTERERRSGVEHANSTAISFNRKDFLAGRKYDQFISVTAHEFFHLWNIKRIRPEGWGPFDYSKIPLSKSHWFTEGVTSYYTSLILVRSGVWSKEEFYRDMAAKISEFEQKPGKRMMSLEECSWNIALRPDNARDTIISCYVKGAIVGFLLDCEIRRRTANQKSLDDVLRYLNQHYAKKDRAYKNQELLQVINEVSGSDFSGFFRRYITGTEDIPYQKFLQPAGLKLTMTEEDPAPYLGIETRQVHGSFVEVMYVVPDSPAYESGINSENILLALNGQRLTSGHWRDLLNLYQPGEKITITLFHRDRLSEKTITLAEKREPLFQIQDADNPSDDQLRLRTSLLGIK